MPLALTVPPPAAEADRVLMVIVCADADADSVMPVKRMFVSGSTSDAPDVEIEPATTGLEILPERLMSATSVPETWVPRSARKRLVSDSGTRPLTDTFRPGPERIGQ